MGVGQPEHSTSWRVLGLGTSFIRPDCSAPWQASEPRLEAATTELWALASWAAALAREHENMSSEAGSWSVYGLGVDCAELNCSAHGCAGEPD